MTKHYVCLCGASFKNITDLREHEEDCIMMHQEEEQKE